MDSAIGINDASTVAPSDSASNIGAAGKQAPSKLASGGPKRSSKAATDKGAPPGAVQVPKAGQNQSKKSSPVVSTTIPLSGWGEIDLHSFRKDIEPTFTTDARPYADLVDTVYNGIQSRYSAGGKHIPRSLFRYYCFTFWWFRALWLHKSNGNVLSSDEKNFLNVLSSGEEFQLPSHVAQYLGNMGNFLQGGESYFFRKAPVDLGESEDALVNKGWFATLEAGNRVGDASFWLYSQYPSPAVAVIDILNECNNTSTNPVAAHNLSAVEPNIPGTVTYPTDNIIGWSNTPISAHHNSWRATFSQLGWTPQRLAPDNQTNFLVSTSTLKWVSERLSCLKDYKVYSSKQISLSVQGHPMQAYWLANEHAPSQKDQFPSLDEIGANRLCASRYSDLAVVSRYSIDPKVLAPAFSFGYRLERSLVFTGYNRDVPQYAQFSNYQPWVQTSADGTAYIPLTPARLAGMNATLTYGSQPFMNVRRFATHELNRSVGLDAALILSDTR